MENGKPNNGIDVQKLTGQKEHERRHFPVSSLDDVLKEVRRLGGTGTLEINFRDGKARGDAKWRGFIQRDP